MKVKSVNLQGYLANIAHKISVSLIHFEHMKYDWTPFLGPVHDQGDCGNCWAESLIQVFSGVTNRYLPENVRKHYANFGDLIVLS